MRTPNKSHNFIENSEQKKFSAEFYFHLGECLTQELKNAHIEKAEFHRASLQLTRDWNEFLARLHHKIV